MNNEEIRKKLIELSDAKYKEFHSGLCPGMDTEMLFTAERRPLYRYQ